MKPEMKRIETLANLLPVNLDNDDIIRFNVNWKSRITGKIRLAKLGSILMTVGNIRNTKLNDYYGNANYEDAAKHGIDPYWLTQEKDLKEIESALENKFYGFHACYNTHPVAEHACGASYAKAKSFNDILEIYTNPSNRKSLSDLMVKHAFHRFILRFEVDLDAELGEDYATEYKQTSAFRIYIGKTYSPYECPFEVDSIEIYSKNNIEKTTDGKFILNRSLKIEKENYREFFSDFAKQGNENAKENLLTAKANICKAILESKTQKIASLKKNIESLEKSIADFKSELSEIEKPVD